MNDLYDALNVFNRFINAVQNGKTIAPTESVRFTHFTIPCVMHITCGCSNIDLERADNVTCEITASTCNGVQVVICKYTIDVLRRTRYIRFADFPNIDANSALGRLYAQLVWLIVDPRATVNFANNTVELFGGDIKHLSAFHF